MEGDALWWASGEVNRAHSAASMQLSVQLVCSLE